MRLLIFSPYYPPHIGGLEFYAEEMHSYLAKQNYLITVFVPRLPASTLPIEYASGKQIKIIRFPAVEVVPNYPLPKLWHPVFWKLFLNLFSSQFDIIISHTRFFNNSFLALVYSKFKRTPWVHIEHGSDFVKSGGKTILFLAKIYDYTIGRLILTHSDKNIAVSAEVALFIKKFNTRKTRVIKRGIDMEVISNISKSKIKYCANNSITIGFVGRLISGKGVHDLITALINLKEQTFICLIIGTGPQEDALTEIINQNNLQGSVFFLGEKNRREALAIMKNFDIFVNPSYTEGLPTTVLEAAACGKAIIATDVGGTNQIITHNKSGYLIAPRDIKALEKRLVDLITNPAKIKLFGQQAQQNIKNNFSWKNSIKHYEDVFKNITKE